MVIWLHQYWGCLCVYTDTVLWVEVNQTTSSQHLLASCTRAGIGLLSSAQGIGPIFAVAFEI